MSQNNLWSVDWELKVDGTKCVGVPWEPCEVVRWHEGGDGKRYAVMAGHERTLVRVERLTPCVGTINMDMYTEYRPWTDADTKKRTKSDSLPLNTPIKMEDGSEVTLTPICVECSTEK